MTLSLLVGACSSEKPDEPPAKPDPVLVAGEQVVKANCFVCHAQGINGAPIIGNERMWAPRAEKGLDTLVSHAMEGFGLMPAKGGSTDLAEADIRAAVRYMLSELPPAKLQIPSS